MSLDHTFSALSDPTRRAILARLALGETSVTELAKPFAMSLPAVSKHLRVLERAGLIARSRAAHEAIAVAWRRRDADAAERAVADHILTALRQITAQIEPGHEPSHAVRALSLRYGVPSD